MKNERLRKRIRGGRKTTEKKEVQSIPEVFSEEVLAEAAGLPDFVSDEDAIGRKDFRDELVFTIDGEHTRDFDDAVSLSCKDGIYTLGVHIADVTHYVKENSALDRSALGRGTSVYFPDRVIPMLPEALSNGICSLNEGVDRLTLSCIMEIDREGTIKDHEICESVIRSAHRMTYNEVQGILDASDGKAMEKYRDSVPTLFRMRELSEILKEKRIRKGALEFETVESEITVAPDGTVTEVKAAERNEATDLIEEFMIAANTTVATEYTEREIPFVYRVHGRPDPEKIRALSRVARTFGVYMKTGRNGKVDPPAMQKLLRDFKGAPEESFISVMALRSMQHAEYSTECTGHFGLAEEMYCHFTSPIRRYPDLQIHRIIKDNLSGKLKTRKTGHYRRILPSVAEQSSLCERRAEEAERADAKIKKCLYASTRIGEEEDAVISGVTAYGIYAMMPDTVEGLIHVTRLPGGYYYFEEERLELRAEATGYSFRMGQAIRVRIDRCDTKSGNVDLALAGEEASREDGRKKKNGKVKSGKDNGGKAKEGASAKKRGKNVVKRKRAGKAHR